MGHNEAMDAINSLIGQALMLFVLAAVSILYVVNVGKNRPRPVRAAIDTVAAGSAQVMVWVVLFLLVPYSVVYTLRWLGVGVLGIVGVVVVVVSVLEPAVGKRWRKLHPSPVWSEPRLLNVLKAKGAAVRTFFAHDTVKAVRADVTALSQEMTLLRDSISGERDEACQELAELQAKVRALPARVRNKHDLS